MLDIQDTIIGRTYFIIGIFFSALMLGPFIIRKINSVLPKRRKQPKQGGELNNPKALIKHAMLNTLVYIVTICVMLILVLTSVFMYYLVAKDVTLGETFTKSIETFNKYLWMNGNMIFAYSPVILASVVLFIVISVYAMTNEDFVSNIEFAQIDSNFMANKKKRNISNKKMIGIDWFRKHYILLIFIASLFIYTIIFVPIWNVDKALYVRSIGLLLLILISSVASLTRWWVMFIVYALIIVGSFTS